MILSPHICFKLAQINIEDCKPTGPIEVGYALGDVRIEEESFHPFRGER